MKFPTLFLVLMAFALCVAPLNAEPRIWTNTKGVEISAEFVSQQNDNVTIRRISDGREFSIALNTLSKADRQWLAANATKSETGGGIYIAAGHGGHRMSSLDGITWTNHEFWDKPSHNQNDLKAIAAGNGICVVVGGFSKSNILTTTDGVEWHKNEFNMGVLSGVMFLDGRFLAFGEGGRVAASADGMGWELIGDAKLRDYLAAEAAESGLEKPIKSDIRRWAHAEGLFVGSGDNGFLITTRDFETWSFPPRIEPQSRLFIKSDGKGFVVQGERTLHHSTDGENWTDVSPELEENTKLATLTHDGERYLANDRQGKGWESADGSEWKAVSGATFPNTIAALRPDLLYSFAIYWKYTEELKYSTDGGKTWESAKLPEPVGMTCVVHATGIPPFEIATSDAAE